MRSVSADALCVAFAYLTHGPWYLPCRLVCRYWTSLLPPETDTGYAAAPARPWELIQERRDPFLMAWARDIGIPWAPHTLNNLAVRGDFAGLEWSVCVAAPEGAMTAVDRVALAAQVVRGGAAVLARTPRGAEDTTGALHWTSAALVKAVVYHGRHGRPAAAAHFAEVWHHCLGLCGWDASALKEAIATANVATVRTVTDHLDCDAALRDDAFWRRLVADSCGPRRRRIVEVFHVIADAPGDDPRRQLPWDALENAAEAGNARMLSAFLAHPRCPLDRSGECAALSTVAAVARPLPMGQAVVLLTVLTSAGIEVHINTLRVAMQSSTIDAVQWILRHAAGRWWTPDEIFLFAIHAGRCDVLDHLFAQQYPFSPGNVLFTQTAAEMGHTAILVRLRERGAAWDHRVIQMALGREHLVTAHWAIVNGCPLATGYITESTEACLRARILSIVCGGGSLPTIN